MAFPFVNFERGTTYCFLAWAVHGLLTNSRPSFPHLVQPLFWTLQIIFVWPFMPYFLHTDPCRQCLATWPSRPHLKQLITWVTSVTSVNSFTSRAQVEGNFSLLLHLFAVWPNLLHLWHLKRGPADSVSPARIVWSLPRARYRWLEIRGWTLPY